MSQTSKGLFEDKEMINTEPGKRLGRIYIPTHYNQERFGAIVRYLTIVPKTIEPKTYNLEVIGTCEFFDPLDNMESVPTYDMTIKWVSESEVKHIELRRSGTHR